MAIKLDLKDKKILTLLDENSRLSNSQIAKKVGLSKPAVEYRLQRFHKNNIIFSYYTVIDFTKLGYLARAKVLLKTTPQERDRLRAFLIAHPSINNLYKINNGFDFMLEAVFKNVKDLEDFLEKTELEFGVTEKNVFYIVEEVSREKFMSSDAIVPLKESES